VFALKLPAASSSFAVTEYVPSTSAEVVHWNVPEPAPLDVEQTEPVATPPMKSWARVSFGAAATKEGAAVGEMKSASHQVGRQVRSPRFSAAMVGPVVSMATVSDVDAADEFPAASVATAVMSRSPSANIAVVHAKEPVDVSAVHPEPDATPPTKSWTPAETSAIPLIVGVESFVRRSVDDAPESLDASRTRPVGVFGAVVSMVTPIAAETTDVTPDVAVAIAVIETVPADSVAVEHENAPVTLSAVHVEPDATPPTYNCTVDAAGAVPTTTRVVAFVIRSEDDAPVSVPEPNDNAVGAAGRGDTANNSTEPASFPARSCTVLESSPDVASV
jgi:hypothetical protein